MRKGNVSPQIIALASFCFLDVEKTQLKVHEKKITCAGEQARPRAISTGENEAVWIVAAALKLVIKGVHLILNSKNI